jgi:hypothetical protein
VKSKFKTLWNDFWTIKDRTNNKLIRASQAGDSKKIRKLLNKLKEAEKIADINYCGEDGLSALHVAAKYN